jgi:tryptophan synthase alpha chain
VDLPPEEESEYIPHLTTQDITPVRLIAPTSLDSRLPKLLEQADGFVYYISVLGVTGTKSAQTDFAG